MNQENNLLKPSNVAATPGSAGFANRNVDYNNRMNDINPEDIQDMTILKGPEATALYGSDGVSGTIVITTKKKTAGKTNVYYDNSWLISNPSSVMVLHQELLFFATSACYTLEKTKNVNP